MIITLTGENSFAVAAAEQQLAQAFTKKHGQHGVEQVDAEGVTPANLPDLLQGSTLFAQKRLVVIKNISANKPLLEPLTAALGSAASDTTVVIADPTLDKRTKLYKFLKTHSTFKEFALLSDVQLQQWAQSEAARLGSSLGAAEARLLVDYTGSDQWRLASELEKLANRPVITIAAIEELVDRTPEGTAFELLDAALTGKVAQVDRLLLALKQNEDPYKLFGLIASQAHTLAVVSAADSRTADTIAKDAGLHPFVVRKAQPLIKRLGHQKVLSVVAGVATCDTHLKSTGADPWELLRLCLIEVSSM